MLPRRLPLGLLLPVALVVLVATLASLQYRWLGQVSEAEREDLSRSLNERARAFADDVDLELSRAYLAFQLGDDPVGPNSTEGITRRLASWQAVARYPELVASIYLADAVDEQYQLYRYDTDAVRWDAVDWPASLESVRARLTVRVTRVPAAGSPESRQVITVSTAPFAPEAPALVVPIPSTSSGESRPGSIPSIESRAVDVLRSFGGGRNFLVIALDRDRLEHTVLPDMAARHFAGDIDDRYRLAVIDTAGETLYQRGPAGGVLLDESHADVAVRFFRLRLDLARSADERAAVFAWRAETTVERPDGTALIRPPAGNLSIVVSRADAESESDVRAIPGPTSWLLLVQHAAGSLDAAVAQARRRNLWLSFGILSVLAAAVGLIVLNARRSERLAAQQMDFVATVSHELRTPLAVIRSAAQNLSAGVIHNAEQAKRYGTLIEAEGQRLTEMVEQILEYAGLSGSRRPLRAVPVDPGALVKDAAEVSTELCRSAGVELEVGVGSALPLVEVDEGAMRRAVSNLVTNALKYAAEGGWIGVAVTRAGTAASPEVLISVSDRGHGIAAEDLAHIFEPFYRGRFAIERQIHGNGLGLSLVRRIAEAHGGSVTVTSSAGTGTTFTIRLPGIEPDPSLQPIGEATARAGHTA